MCTRKRKDAHTNKKTKQNDAYRNTDTDTDIIKIYKCTNTIIQTYTQKHICSHTNTNMHTQKSKDTHANKNTYTEIYTQKKSYNQANTYMNAQRHVYR